VTTLTPAIPEIWLGSHENFNGRSAWLCPFRGALSSVGYKLLRSIYLPNFNSSSTHYEDI